MEACGNTPVNVVVGGPPVRDFRMRAGEIRTTRETSCSRILLNGKPAEAGIFVMENVPGILTMRKGMPLKKLLRLLLKSVIM